jgi:hypothetical protein
MEVIVYRFMKFVVMVISIISAGSRCPSAFITYPESVTGSGRLGGVAFSGSLLRITLASDASTIDGGVGRIRPLPPRRPSR